MSLEVTPGSPRSGTVPGNTGEITPLTIRNHRLGAGTSKTVLTNLGGDGSGFGEVFGFQSADDNLGLDHPDDNTEQQPGNRYALRYEGP